MARKRGGHDNITVVAAEFGELKRVKGLGIRAKTVSVKSAKLEKERKKRKIFIASIGLLVAIFIFLAYLFISHYAEQYSPFKRPTMEEKTDVEGDSSQ